MVTVTMMLINNDGSYHCGPTGCWAQYWDIAFVIQFNPHHNLKSILLLLLYLQKLRSRDLALCCSGHLRVVSPGVPESHLV